ncbi:hypothetical protein BH11PLA2_BH11PLA2_22650 [soil metagenome]
MFIEALFEDHLLLAGNPPQKSAWAKQWIELPTDRPVTADTIVDLPFILPKADANRRKQFDEWCFQSTGK